MNQARYFLPHLYALSVNSPFWVGRNTGLKGYRLKVFERFPRTGIPDAFESLSEYEDYCKLLVKTGCVDNAKKIWWDIRLHPFFDTLEIARVRRAIAGGRYAGHCRADPGDRGQALQVAPPEYRPSAFIAGACSMRIAGALSRYGLDGKLIDFGRETEVETRSLLDELLEFVSTEVDELGSRREMAHIERIMREGTGADRQLAVFQRTNDMKAVVDQIVTETYEGLTGPGATARANALPSVANRIHAAFFDAIVDCPRPIFA